MTAKQLKDAKDLIQHNLAVVQETVNMYDRNGFPNKGMRQREEVITYKNILTVLDNLEPEVKE